MVLLCNDGHIVSIHVLMIRTGRFVLQESGQEQVTVRESDRRQTVDRERSQAMNRRQEKNRPVGC